MITWEELIKARDDSRTYGDDVVNTELMARRLGMSEARALYWARRLHVNLDPRGDVVRARAEEREWEENCCGGNPLRKALLALIEAAEGDTVTVPIALLESVLAESRGAPS